jgi:hypothetical protein
VVAASAVVEDVVVSAEAADKRHSYITNLLESFEPRHKNATHEGVVGKKWKGVEERRETSVFFWRYTVLFPICCCRSCLVLVFPPLALISDPTNVRPSRGIGILYRRRGFKKEEERENKDGQPLRSLVSCLVSLHDCAVYDDYNYRRSPGYKN